MQTQLRRGMLIKSIKTREQKRKGKNQLDCLALTDLAHSNYNLCRVSTHLTLYAGY